MLIFPPIILFRNSFDSCPLLNLFFPIIQAQIQTIAFLPCGQRKIIAIVYTTSGSVPFCSIPFLTVLGFLASHPIQPLNTLHQSKTHFNKPQ